MMTRKHKADALFSKR